MRTKIFARRLGAELKKKGWLERSLQVAPTITSVAAVVIAFATFYRLYIYEVDALGAGAATTVADAPDGAGTWNRDGVILFAPSARSGLFRGSEFGGMPIPVTQLEPASDRGHVRPQFLPDGRHFLYLVREPNPSCDSGRLIDHTDDHARGQATNLCLAADI
jgi:hypothetical protein